jgi:hypothetical protein
LQLARACCRRVFCFAGLHRCQRGVLDILRRVKVRLTRAEVHYINTCSAHRFSGLHGRQGR